MALSREQFVCLQAISRFNTRTALAAGLSRSRPGTSLHDCPGWRNDKSGPAQPARRLGGHRRFAQSSSSAYNPLLTTWCRRMRLDAETADELCQRIWIELARRIASFRYDPSKTFRGWLRRLLYSRTVDLLRARRTDPLQLAEDERSELLERLNDPSDSDEGEESAQPPALLELAKQVQDSVQSHVEPRTWQAFWSIAVEGKSVRETAEALNLSYAAAFAAHKRVVRRLQEAGARRCGPPECWERYPASIMIARMARWTTPTGLPPKGRGMRFLPRFEGSTCFVCLSHR